MNRNECLLIDVVGGAVTIKSLLDGSLWTDAEALTATYYLDTYTIGIYAKNGFGGTLIKGVYDA